MLNFLMGYLVGSATSQSQSVPAQPPMSEQEAALWVGFIGVGALLAFGALVRYAKRGL